MTDLNVALILRFIDQATGPARAAMRNIQGAAERVEQFGQHQIAAGQAMQAVAVGNIAALRGEALGLAAVGYAFAGLMGPAVRFEAQMDRVGAISRASAEDQERLTAVARQLGASTQYSAGQVADGMGFFAQAGFSVNETIAAMPGLLNLAAAAQTDLGRTSDITSGILRGFQMRTDETGRLGDVLVNTFTSSNTTLENLGHTMAYVAPQAAAAGAELEQVAAMAGLLGNNNIRGEMAGTALRAVLSRLAAPGNEAAEALARLNVQVSDEGGNLRDIPTILGEMDRAMTGMGTATRQELLTTIFGQEAATAALILTSEAGQGSLQAYAERLRESGTAATLAEQLTDNAAGALERLMGAVDDVRLSLGNGFLPVLADLAERLVPVIDQIGAWVSANPELVSGAMKVAAGLIAINAGMLALKIGFWLLFGWMGKVISIFGTLLVVGSRLTIWAIAASSWLSKVGVAFLALTRLPRFALAALLVPIRWGAALIGAIPWVALAGRLSWAALIPALSWVALRLIPVIGWAMLAGELAWHLLIVPLGWQEYIPTVDWSYWFSFQWVDVLPAWNWSAIIPSFPGFGAAPSATSSDPAERAAAGRRAQSLGYGGAAAPVTGARATGGPVMPGLLYRINEQGLEGFTAGDYLQPLTAGRILPAGQTQRLMGGGGQSGGSLTVGAITINTLPGMDGADVARQVRDQIVELMREARFALHDGGQHV